MPDSALGPPLVIRDHLVEGLFVKEVAPTAPGGPETPLLFVHGAAHGWWAWEKWLGFFAAAGWRCYAMSLRNHTGSRAVAEPEYLRLRVADYAEDIRTLARWLDGPPVLIGHSMGGISAQKAAEGLDLKGLVLVASVGPGQLGRIREPLPEDRPITYTAARAREQWFRDIDDLSLARAIARFYGGACLIVPDAAHDLMLEEAALPVAIRLNQWLLEAVDQPRLARIAPAEPSAARV